MSKHEIDEAAFERAFGGLSKIERQQAVTAITMYLAALQEPEPARDRIAVVVDERGRVHARRMDGDKFNWNALENAAPYWGVGAHVARAIVRCNLPRPAQAIEVDGTVEGIG